MVMVKRKVAPKSNADQFAKDQNEGLEYFGVPGIGSHDARVDRFINATPKQASHISLIAKIAGFDQKDTTLLINLATLAVGRGFVEKLQGPYYRLKKPLVEPPKIKVRKASPKPLSFPTEPGNRHRQAIQVHGHIEVLEARKSLAPNAKWFVWVRNLKTDRNYYIDFATAPATLEEAIKRAVATANTEVKGGLN